MPFAPLEGVRRGCRAVVSAVRAAVRPTRRPGSAGWSTPWASRSTARARCRRDRCRIHSKRRRRRHMPAGGSARRSISACARSTPSSPAATASAWAFSAGSGVGKSVLLSMMARNVVADVSVIGLVGERGREVQEFLQDDLGEEGLARSVVVVATSDEPALMRRQAAYLTLADRRIFPRSGQAGAAADGLGDPLCRGPARDRACHRRAADRERLYADGVCRAAAAPGAGRARLRRGQRSPASSRCWSRATTTTSRLPTRCARSSTAISSWSAPIAERGRYPAINVLKSVSRSMPQSADPAYLEVLTRARKVMATYADMEELIRLGAYRPGSSAEVDEAIGCTRRSRPFSARTRTSPPGLLEGYQRLEQILAGCAPPERQPAKGLTCRPRKNPLPCFCSAAGNRKLTLSRHTRPGCPLFAGAAGVFRHVRAASGE